MIIFLRRIPQNTMKHEIIDYITPCLKGGLLRKTGSIEHIKILILKNTQSDQLEFHGLVTISPDSVAERIIKKLNKQPFKSKVIAVREYHFRSWHNDPRTNMHERSEELEDHRVANRRRARLEVVKAINASLIDAENDLSVL